jgi:hypothetical protein
VSTPLSRALVQARLERVFPRDVFDNVMSNPLAAAAVVAFLHANVIIDDTTHTFDGARLLRPSAVLWMTDAAEKRTTQADLDAWFTAVSTSKRSLETLHTKWGEPFTPWYGDNTRETLRDETFSEWEKVGAIRQDRTVATTSSKPRWVLTESFAKLFEPGLTDEETDARIAAWLEQNLDPGRKLAIQARRTRATGHEVEVTLPSGTKRRLAPGDASHILKGVVEAFAPAVLQDPHVVTISEPGDKVYIEDQKLLASAGITINVSDLLPDAILIDIGPSLAVLWFVEAVATDGPIDDARREALTAWAGTQGFTHDRLRFLTAFTSRSSAPIKRRLKDIASNSYVWFADEPGLVLEWRDLS